MYGGWALKGGRIDFEGQGRDGCGLRRKPLDRIEGIDRVRALAALSVMLAHLIGPFVGEFRYIFTGGPAVIAFFVVSGFCIHYPYVRKPLPVTAFLAARWTRIVIPSAVAMLLAQLLGIWPYNPIDGYILWSIVCELWYYSVYPLLLLLSRRVPWWAQAVAGTVISYALVLILPRDAAGNIHAYGPLLNWIIMLPAWLLGALLAEDVAKHRPTVSVPRVWSARLSVAVVAAGLYWLTTNTVVGFNLTLLPFSVLVYWWLREEIAVGRDADFLGWLGKRSYSIYLMHIVVAAVLALLAPSLWPFMVAGAAVAGSLVFYAVVEAPAHRLARSIFRSRRALGAQIGASPKSDLLEEYDARERSQR
jgi:peptidoglycan/LPS O-acetylase OafA/YrhL